MRRRAGGAGDAGGAEWLATARRRASCSDRVIRRFLRRLNPISEIEPSARCCSSSASRASSSSGADPSTILLAQCEAPGRPRLPPILGKVNASAGVWCWVYPPHSLISAAQIRRSSARGDGNGALASAVVTRGGDLASGGAKEDHGARASRDGGKHGAPGLATARSPHRQRSSRWRRGRVEQIRGWACR